MLASISPLYFKNPLSLYDPTPNAYSHIASIMLKDIEEIIHISGQGGESIDGNLSQDFTQQCCNVFLNLKNVLESMQLSWDNIAQMNILIRDHSAQKHKILIEHMQQYFHHARFPSCTLIPVPRLALDHMQIEIGAVAYRFNLSKVKP